MTKKTSVWIAAVLMAGSLGLLSAGAANGAAFRVGFDPTFSGSGTYANLGFQGSGDLTIDDGCFDNTGESTVGTGNCTFAYFTSLTLQLYDVKDGPGTILETLSYAPPNQDIGGVASHIVVAAPGDLVGIDTAFLGPVTATPILSGSPTPQPPDPLPNASLISIEFLANFHAFPFSVDPNVILQICNLQGANCESSTEHATVTFSRVAADTIPEPGSAVLIVTALGALAWLRRSRTRA